MAAGADPAVIRLRYAGQEALKLDDAGNLALETPPGEIKFSAPILYQEIAGQRVPVDGRFILAGADTVVFQVAAYDNQHPLIIDPTLAYAGYVGGIGAEVGTGIAVDSTGATYVTGYTESAQATFPVIVGPDLTYAGGVYDAFVAKVKFTIK